ncbi:DNA repair ATPase [Orenia marismortui]|uniref:DNA repair ATPase n=1 Tax=Orenia marismortui TaxID=46469 RepID=UPI0003A83231|nr:DNA repair ATPase [Orenia marismortui]
MGEEVKQEKKQENFASYNVIRNRLTERTKELKEKLEKLDQKRIEIYGEIKNTLKKSEAIVTENSCIPRDIVPVGNKVILGYNVHLGLKSESKLSDVFSIYTYNGDRFVREDYSLLNDKQFKSDFKELYKYYKDSFFTKFHEKDNFIYMVFQNGDKVDDIKSFKWVIKEDKSIEYLGNRFSHEILYPTQQEIEWKITTREDQVAGLHPHISIEDRIFVETIGGTLTLKIEDNTNSGEGIYAEEVEQKDQKLDDADIFYSIVGNLILLKIKPYQEENYRYIVFNEKTKEVQRIDSIAKSVVLLPEDHGIIFPDGIFLQAGGFKKFQVDYQNVVFQNKKASINGEDYQYIFYDIVTGEYYIHNYNIIHQDIETPIICNGYSHFDNGELIIFKAGQEPKRNHTIQIWQTSFVKDILEEKDEKKDEFLYNIGNKEIVRLMADCYSLYSLSQKDDSYYGLYVDIVKDAENIINNYFWLDKKEAFNIKESLLKIKEAGAIAIKEFDKVTKIKENTTNSYNEVKEKVEDISKAIGYTSFENINDFVKYLTKIRKVRGEISALKDLQFIDEKKVEDLSKKIKEKNDKLSLDCTNFLLKDESLNPYIEEVKSIENNLTTVEKLVDGKELNQKIVKVSEELEMLINIVNTLKIEDATKTSEIIDKISVLFSNLNQSKSKLKNKIDNLNAREKEAEFYSKLNLLTHSVSNYLDLSTNVEKTEDYMSKIIVQIDELESKFSDFDEFLVMLTEKRDEVISTFESKKQQLIEKKNKKIDSLSNAADRIFKSLKNRVKSFEEVSSINELLSTSPMVDKIRDIIEQLIELGDSTKADDIENKLKSLKESSIKQLKDKKELFLDENTIKFGNNHFLVNNQKPELSLLKKEDGFYFHISGTDFWEQVDAEEFSNYQEVWDQKVISENEEVYRGEFLAYNIFKNYQENNSLEELYQKDEQTLNRIIKEYIQEHSNEYYTKGVHDHDAYKILSTLVNIYWELELASYNPKVRAVANLFWQFGLIQERKEKLQNRLKTVNMISKYSKRGLIEGFIPSLAKEVESFVDENPWIETDDNQKIAEYLAKEISQNETFVLSVEAAEIYENFDNFLISKGGKKDFKKSLENLSDDLEGRYILVNEWVQSYLYEEELEFNDYIYEVLVSLILGDYSNRRAINKKSEMIIDKLVGTHKVIDNGKYQINLIDFLHKLDNFKNKIIPQYQKFQQLKFAKIEEIKNKINFNDLQPKVLTSFVRSKLIDQVYLPLIGDNLAKQIGTAGKNKRTDNMGMLLMISPPGYGKTTLMEYVANRLSMMLVKVNCPTIGHGVTSLDPAEAKNAGAREELKKLNLAFELGNNVMIYLDDIQHSNPEFLQKFISLCDGQRKIEGVYNGVSKTYEFRGKKVAVVMAGNPYTESGDKFKIPDMLANRADVYNLGDMLRENEEAFKLSYIENAVTSNTYLNNIYMKDSGDIYKLIQAIDTGDRGDIDLNGSYTEEEIEEALSVLESCLKIRDEILKVNMEYIYSSSQSDEYRTEPPFKLQGSYRNINKIVEKVVPIMNDNEIKGLVENSYINDAQTLATEAEASLLKFYEISNRMTEEQQQRWQEIKEIYLKKKSEKDGQNVIQVIQELNQIGESLKLIGNSMK